MRAVARGSVLALAVVAACRISDAHFQGFEDGGGSGRDDGGVVGDGQTVIGHAVLYTTVDGSGSNGYAYLVARDATGGLIVDPAHKAPIDAFVAGAGVPGEAFVVSKSGTDPAYVRALSLAGGSIAATGADSPLGTCLATHAAAIPTQVLVGCAGQSFMHVLVSGGALSSATAQSISNANSARAVAFAPSMQCAYIADGVGNMLHAFKVGSNGVALSEIGSGHTVTSGVDQIAVDDTGMYVLVSGTSAVALFDAASDCSVGAQVDSIAATKGRVLIDSAHSVAYVAGGTAIDAFAFAPGLTLVDHHPVSTGISDAALDPDLGLLYVVDVNGVTTYHLGSNGAVGAVAGTLAMPRATALVLEP